MTELTIPDASGLHSALGKYRGERAYLIPMTDAHGAPLGNNGDVLMHRVFHRLLRELAITVTDTPRDAGVIVVPPSGALLESYSFPKLLTERLLGLESQPVVIFPSSAYFPTWNPAAMFRTRTAETLLLLREAHSYNHLRDSWGTDLESAGVSLVLDHDVVASGHKYVPEIVGQHRGRGGGMLVAARRDRERNASTMDAPASSHASTSRVGRQIASLVPYGRARTALTRRARRAANEAAAEELLRSALSVIGADSVATSSLKAVRVDASATQFATFSEYSRLIANADFVLSNRLHVGLPAAILGKQVVLVEGGYHKISGVYAQSLQRVPNVVLVDTKGA